MLSLTPLFPHSTLLHHQSPPFSTHQASFRSSNPRTPLSPGLSFPLFSHYTPSTSSYLQIPFVCPPEPEPEPTSTSSRDVDSGLLVRLLRSCASMNELQMVHAVVVKCLSDSLLYVNNNLVSGYLELGGLVQARKVFDEMPERNVVSWTAMIDGYVRRGLDDEALRLFEECVEGGVVGSYKTFVCMLNLCGWRLDFELGREVHACVVKGGCGNLIVDSALVCFYARCGDLTSAFCMFDRMVEKDVVCWTGLITACSQQGRGNEALALFSRMLGKGFLPNEFTVCSVLKACGEEKALKFGRQLHCAVVKKVCREDVYVGTSLVDMYGKCGEVLDSRRVFSGMRNRNTVTWTSIIAGYARKGLGREAISLFRVMRRKRIMSNNLTMVSVLRACGSIGALLTGREIHAQVVKNWVELNEYLETTLVWLYCKCGESRVASKVLQQMPLRDSVSWTAIISGYSGLGHESEALGFLKKMVEEGVEPNSYTCSSALKACANLDSVVQGKLIHSYASKTPASSNVFVGSALICMYAKCGYVSEASQVFYNMPEHNLVSWKAMILGYARNGHCQEALKLIYRIRAEGVELDDYVLATVLNTCGEIDGDPESPSEACNLVDLTLGFNYSRA